MKQGVRILAIDGSPFRREDKEALIIGVVGRSGIIEGVLSFKVAVDGDDSTDRIIKAVENSRFSEQIKVIALNGITLAGINIIDIMWLRKSLKMHIVAMTRSKPHANLLKRAVAKWGDKKRAKLVSSINDSVSIIRKEGYYVQYLDGTEAPSAEMTKEIVQLLRISHIIASGVASGESRGRL